MNLMKNRAADIRHDKGAIGHGKSDQKGSARLFGRAGYVHHHPVAEGKLQQLRGDRGSRRRGPGQGAFGLEEKAKKTGASKLYIEDLRQEFVEEYIFPTIKAGAVYENQYLLGTSFARPIIAKRLVEIAKKEGADAIAHGCTGKGNDQVRFELAIKAYAPKMKIIAPWRTWELKSRDEEIDYAEAHNVPLNIDRTTNYSKDKNLWHLSHEGLDLEDPANEPKYDEILEMGVTPEKAPDQPTYITLSLKRASRWLWTVKSWTASR